MRFIRVKMRRPSSVKVVLMRRYVMPKGPKVAAALIITSGIGGIVGSDTYLAAVPTIVATKATPHNWGRNPGAGGDPPFLRSSPRRSKVNSTHPAIPAEAVSPATPHLGSIPI